MKAVTLVAVTLYQAYQGIGLVNEMQYVLCTNCLSECTQIAYLVPTIPVNLRNNAIPLISLVFGFLAILFLHVH